MNRDNKRMNAIEVKDLRKSYGKVEVLKGINLEVERGSLLALLGPNGAGKTTTVRMRCTHLTGPLLKSTSSRKDRRVAVRGRRGSDAR